jgi:hypothetical protein
MNIIIEPIHFKALADSPKILPSPQLLFDPIVKVEPKEEGYVVHTSFAGPGIVIQKLDWILHLTPKYATTNYEMVLRFTDILGNPYRQIIHLGKAGCWPDVVVPDNSTVYPVIGLAALRDEGELSSSRVSAE